VPTKRKSVAVSKRTSTRRAPPPAEGRSKRSKSSVVAPATPTLKDVARASGVSVGTVSNVINNHPRVTYAIKKRVDDVIYKLGFKPDSIAQSMRSGQTKTLACVVRDLTVPILSTFVDSMQNTVDAHGFSLFVASSYHDLSREISLLTKFSRRRVDGIVIATSSETDPKLITQLRESTTPIVLLDRKLPEQLDSVLVDHRGGVRQAMDYLISLGHTRIGFISGQDAVSPVQERLRGYYDALDAKAMPRDARLVRTGSFGIDYAYSEAVQFFELSDPPTAIVAGGTTLLAGVLRAAREVGRRIPEDVSIIGGQDSELAQLHSPAITVIRWDHAQLGVAAARFLINRLKSAAIGIQRIISPSELVVRGSCAIQRDAGPGSRGGTSLGRHPKTDA
jgi:LacI family transcriptional regulator